MPDPSRLVPCPDCEQLISRRAPVCLHCGREIRPTPWGIVCATARGISKLVFYWLLFTAIFMVVGWGVFTLGDLFSRH